MKSLALRQTIRTIVENMPITNIKMRQSVVDHFQAEFGVGEHVLKDGDIDMYEWPDPSENGSRILATVGMAEQVQFRSRGKEVVSAPRTELVMFSLPRNVASMARILIDVTQYPNRQKSFIHWCHVLPLGVPIVPNSELRNLFFTFPPFGDEFPTLRTEGCRVDILWVVPISDGERKLFETEGTDALDDQLEKSDVDVSDLLRASTV